MIELKNTQLQTPFNVLLIGDSCNDLYKIGTVDRLSPEAPVPVIKVIKEYTVPGMASNVKLNLLNLGINVEFITNDEIISKSRYIDSRSGQHLLRVDEEPLLKNWNRVAPMHMSKYDAIIISDYNKGFLSYEDIEYIISQTKKPIFIDTKKQDLSRFSADWVYIKINETEYKNRFSLSKNLIVTLGDRGAMLKTQDPDLEIIYATKNVEVMDVCGCGDTFLSALSYQYLITNNIDESIIFANKAASLSVQHRGNYAPTLKEIINA